MFDCGSVKITPSAQFLINILLVFITFGIFAPAIVSDVNGSQNRVQGSRLMIPCMGTFEFFIDFQDFLKIDLEIIQMPANIGPGASSIRSIFEISVTRSALRFQ